MITMPLRVTDSTSGTASTTGVIDDTTASVKDDAATVAAFLNRTWDNLIQIIKTQSGEQSS